MQDSGTGHNAMLLELCSNTICPWCYLGRCVAAARAAVGRAAGLWGVSA
jgi:predicted DsbA family dithiol-disulfide isomerase